MKQIACAILCIGLCFVEAYKMKNDNKTSDLEGIIAFAAALVVIFSR